MPETASPAEVVEETATSGLGELPAYPQGQPSSEDSPTQSATAAAAAVNSQEAAEKTPSPAEVASTPALTKKELPSATEPDPDAAAMGKEVTAPAVEVQASEGQDSVLALGEELYNKAGSCVTCHQAGGQGLPPAFPPLAGSEWVTGPAENLIRIQLRGLMGEIKVGDTIYNGVMPPVTDGVFPQTDENIAAVLTYVRHTFGAGASPILPEMVAEYKAEKGQPMLSVVDLADPFAKPETVGVSAADIKLVDKPATDLPSPGLGLPFLAIFLIVTLTALSAIALFRMKGNR